IVYTGQLWDIEPLEEKDLPRSLKEMIRQKIAVLNEENRKLLDQASTFGEQVSLSMLGGSSDTKEGKVLDFIDEGVALGLIGSKYQRNDETIRFLSRSILDITYDAIEENRKRELHERIGNYQETRHAQGLLLSATTLAYHFQRSSNQTKARFYRESQQAYDQKIFTAEGARHYNGVKLADFGPAEIPLDPVALAHIPEVIRTLLTTTRKIQLYPPGSPAIVSATGQLKESIDKILVHSDRLNITQVKKALSVNGEPLDVTPYNSIAETFVTFMIRLELHGIAFSRGLTEQELQGMLESLDQVSTKVIDRRFWQRFVSKQGLSHIELEQVRYTPTAEADGLQEAVRIPPKHDAASLLAADQGLDEQDLNQVPRVVRCLLTATNNIKLYPPQSQIIRRSIEELWEALQTILDRRPALTLARVQEALLVNGQKVETQDFRTIADGFLNLLETIGLRSLSFLQHISSQELTTFITALRQPPIEGFDRSFWLRLAQDQGLSGILFDQRTYEILERQAGVGTAQAEPWEKAGTEKDLEPGQMGRATGADLPAQGDLVPEPVQPPEAFPRSMEVRLRDLFLKGDKVQARQLIRQFFQEFDHQIPQIRTETIQICGRLLKELDSQPRLAELLTSPLLLAFAKEDNAQLLEEMAALLFRTGIHLILLADYTQANRIFAHLGQRQRKQREKPDQEAGPQKWVVLQGLDPKTRRLLWEDLKSQDPTRVEETKELLKGLGPVALPLLLEVIKEEDNVELRQIVSRLLGRLGQEAATVLKRELVLEGIAEQRVRILEAIGEITRDLKTELGYALEEESPKVRRAAFRLLQSFHDERLISLLFDYVNHPDVTVAVAAVRSLGRVKPAGAVDVLVSLINSAWEKERVISACQALGKIADPAGIEPLAQLMAPRGLFWRQRRRSPLVRAAAASALAQISHPKVAKVLARHLDDNDSRVRQIAHDIVNRP
ncbi:MAG: HEAT repeat domain-containing protein, partial [Acidobacteriota bacterium]